jgi:hypothetical protein
LSTFSADVDTRELRERPSVSRVKPAPAEKEAVRIEELLNYFRYDYPQPKGKEPVLMRQGSRELSLGTGPSARANRIKRAGRLPRTKARRRTWSSSSMSAAR